MKQLTFREAIKALLAHKNWEMENLGLFNEKARTKDGRFFLYPACAFLRDQETGEVVYGHDATPGWWIFHTIALWRYWRVSNAAPRPENGGGA